MGGMMDADEQFDLQCEAMAQDRAAMAHEPEPTKRIVMDMSSDECQLETTYEHLNSVELGQTAKGDTQIKSVKVYHIDPGTAAIHALNTFRWLRGQI